MATNIDIVLSVLRAAQSRSEIDRTGGSLKGLGDKADDAGRRFNKAGREIDDAGRFVKSAGNEADAAGGKFGKMGQMLGGLGITAVGAGMVALSQKFREAATEGDGVSKRLESILKQQGRTSDSKVIDEQVQRVTVEGHFADDDEIKNAAVLAASFSVETKHMGDVLELSARQARTMGMEVGGVATAMAKAYSTGNVSALRRTGVALSEQEADAVKAAYGISQAAGQLKFMEVVGAAVRKTTVNLSDSLTDAQAKANDLARAGDDAMTAMGRGANNAAATIGGIGTSILVAANEFPGLLEQAGALQYVGGYALTAGGSILGVAGNIGMVAMAFPGLAAAGSATWAVLTAGAVTFGTAAWAALAPILPVVLAIGAALGAITAVAVWWQNKKKAASDAEGLELDKKRYELEQAAAKRQGRAPLSDFDTWRGTDGSEDTVGDPAVLDKHMETLKKLEAAGLPGGATKLPADKLDVELDADEMPPIPVVAVPSATTTIPAQLPSTPSAIIPPVPSSGDAARDARVQRALAAGATGDETFPEGILDGSKEDAQALDRAIKARSTAAALSNGADAYTSQIRALQEKARNTKDKRAKAELRREIQALQDAKSAASKADRLANKQAADAARLAARNAKFAAKGTSSVIGATGGGDADEIAEARTEAKDIAQEALDDALDAIKRQIKSKAIKPDVGNEKMQALRDVFEAEQAAADALADAQIKNVKARTLLAQAAALAATQSGAERQATMDKANADAARLRRSAERDTRKAARETRNAAEAKAEAGKPATAAFNLDAAFAKLAARRGGGLASAGSRMAGLGSGAFAAADSFGAASRGPAPASLAQLWGGPPKHMMAKPIGQDTRGARRYLVELSVPDSYGRDVDGVT